MSSTANLITIILGGLGITSFIWQRASRILKRLESIDDLSHRITLLEQKIANVPNRTVETMVGLAQIDKAKKKR